MFDHIVPLAVQKLDALLENKVGLWRGVREDVEWLRGELQWMKSFIKDVEAIQGKNNRLQQWMSDITDVAYEIGDIVERFSYEIEAGASAATGGIMDYIRISGVPNNLYNIGREIKSLREKIHEISRRRKAYGMTINLGDGGQGMSVGLNKELMTALRRRTPNTDEDHVGVKDCTRKVLADLLNGETQRCIVSIYGMGGLGKTTLASKIFNSVSDKFKCKGWVCVSQEYRIEDLLRSIIKSFEDPTLTATELKMMEKMNEQDLDQHLHKYLKGNKYLVVLDDVWDKKVWKILRRAFPNDNNGSRVIITTRNQDVASILDDRTFTHRLRFLSTEESWDLFCKKAFIWDGEAGSRSPAKEELGREMVGKCDGLPLAIIVLGGLLLHKQQLEQWYKVKEHIWRHLRNDSIEISQLLSLSYYDLSSQMKPCFLYLGMFPEDYPISARKLMFMWIAEEFIPQEAGRMEDVAEEYLNELNNRCLIQVTQRENQRSIIYCKVHDLLRDLAIQKAREENFFDIYDPRKGSALLLSRRHAVHSHIMQYFSLDHSNSRLRSLVFFDPDYASLETMQLEFIPTNFKSLRVLDFNKVKFLGSKRLPGMFGKLIHLRFLWLENNILKLPRSIGNLKYLQILAALQMSLPEEIRRLKQLRHIDSSVTGPLPVESLTSLQTLQLVHYEPWLGIDTVNLINLRKLTVWEPSKQKGMDSLNSITNLKSLEVLHLVWCSDVESPSLQRLSSCQHLLKLTLTGRIEKLPAIKELPQRLEVLVLDGSNLEEDPMPILERLPNLIALYLLKASYKGKKMVCTAGGFRQLEFLKVHVLTELEEWQVEEGAMPVIKAFMKHICPKLKKLPEKLASVIIPWSSDNNW